MRIIIAQLCKVDARVWDIKGIARLWARHLHPVAVSAACTTVVLQTTIIGDQLDQTINPLCSSTRALGQPRDTFPSATHGLWPTPHLISNAGFQSSDWQS